MKNKETKDYNYLVEIPWIERYEITGRGAVFICKLDEQLGFTDNFISYLKANSVPVRIKGCGLFTIRGVESGTHSQLRGLLTRKYDTPVKYHEFDIPINKLDLSVTGGKFFDGETYTELKTDRKYIRFKVSGEENFWRINLIKKIYNL